MPFIVGRNATDYEPTFYSVQRSDEECMNRPFTQYKHVVIIERLAPHLNGGNSGNIEYSYEYIGMSTEQCVRILVHRYTV